MTKTELAAWRSELQLASREHLVEVLARFVKKRGRSKRAAKRALLIHDLATFRLRELIISNSEITTNLERDYGYW